MMTLAILRQAGAACGYEYTRTFAILRDWASPKAWMGLPAPGENASAARSATNVLRRAQSRCGGTHFEVLSNGVVRSAVAVTDAA